MPRRAEPEPRQNSKSRNLILSTAAAFIQYIRVGLPAYCMSKKSKRHILYSNLEKKMLKTSWTPSTNYGVNILVPWIRIATDFWCPTSHSFSKLLFKLLSTFVCVIIVNSTIENMTILQIFSALFVFFVVVESLRNIDKIFIHK